MTPREKWQAIKTNATPTVKKAFAYITRKKEGTQELLVFRHWNPEAGIQVPKGTIEKGESPAEAVMREAFEETGLDTLELVSLVATDVIHFPFADDDSSVQERHFFHLKITYEAHDNWTHEVQGSGVDEGMKFAYYWLALEQKDELIANMGDYVQLLN